MLLHLAAEVANPGAVEVLDLSQCGTRDDVAALVELALLLGAVLHLGQRTLRETNVKSDLVGPKSDFVGVIACAFDRLAIFTICKVSLMTTAKVCMYL